MLKTRPPPVLTNHAKFFIILLVIIRVSGQFTRLLSDWLDRNRIVDPVLHDRLARLSKCDTVTAEEWREALTLASRHTGDSHFGLQVGMGATLGHVGILGYLVLNSATLFDALHTYQISERRFYGVNFCIFDSDENQVSLTWPNTLGEENDLFVQVSLAALVGFLRQRFPTTFALISVALSETHPEYCAPYEQYFGCPIEFGSDYPGILVNRSCANQSETGQLPRASYSLRDQQAQAFSDLRSERTPFLQKLQETLMQLIPLGQASLGQVADAMDMSPRTLQRRLGDHHLSFQSLLDGLRENLGCRYLQRRGLSQVDIALLLGFSEQSAFNRAFKNWTGSTPGVYQNSAPNTGTTKV